MANNILKITATFIGKNGSLGYETGKEYELTVPSSKQIVVYREELGKGHCVYESLAAFLKNWKNIKTL